VLVIGVAGCGDAGSGGDPGSGGAAPAGTPLEIGAAPLLELGAAEGDSASILHRVLTPFLLPGGEVAVPLAADRAIRIYAADGRLARTLGRPGQGPGEFVDLSAAWLRGDTVEAYDFRMQRITRFIPGGSVQEVVLESVPFGSGPVRGGLAGGWLLRVMVNPDPAARPARSRDTLALAHFGRDGRRLGDVTRMAGLARFSTPGGRTLPEPLSPEGRVALHGDLIFVGDTREPVLRVLDATGDTVRDIRWIPAAGVSPRDPLRAVLDSVFARTPSERLADVRQRYRDAPAPDGLSVFWDLIVDDEGFLWVRPYDPLLHSHALGGWAGVGPGGDWWVFGPDGDRVAVVRVPAGLVPTHIASHAVAGVHRDDDGVESVRVHALRRR
jgi:hypothetical protein